MRIIIIITMLLLLYGCPEFSGGGRTGVITKFSRRGLLCKTYEGTLSLGFMKNGAGTMSRDEWKFTVADDSVVGQVQEFADRGMPVKLTYSQKYWVFPCFGDTNYFITKVEGVE